MSVLSFIKTKYYLFRYGELTETIKDCVSGVAFEIEYKDKKGRTVGYFAYGYYDPSFQYQGQKEFTIKGKTK